ncbi:hypothetical protein [Streptomyces sp. CA-146814]|uniref:hypothetical protein n=1 Tax=Streptomyces sp. CA-146814 TaxID=3240053 RepID=UPI003D92D1B6
MSPRPVAGGSAYVVGLEPPVHVPVHALWPAHTTCPDREMFLGRVGDGAGDG